MNDGISFGQLIKNNKKVIENYFFMTVLQFLNSLFYLIIYPLIIRRLGVENYGIYVFDLSIVTYFIVLISFGFDLPSVNKISKNSTNFSIKSKVVSEVLSSKIYLFIVSSVIFLSFLYLINSEEKNKTLFLIVYLQSILNVLVPTWYFQGIQKMKVVTYIQIIFKIITLPFILLLINSSNDLILFSVIMTSSVVLSGVSIFLYLLYNEKLKITILKFKEIKSTLKEAIPFFWSTSTSIIRQQSTNVIIGVFIGMSGVAYYDLASKLILLPQSLASSINGALFPKIVTSDKVNKSLIKKIINYEIYFGLFIITILAFVGKFAVLILGGEQMITSYYLTLLLSITILTWLIVGCYINFIFVPKNQYKYISYNQFVAFFVYLAISIIGVLIFKNIYVIVIASVLSGISEIIYCKYIINKKITF